MVNYTTTGKEIFITHKTVGNIVTASYFTGAGLSLFAPPPLVNRKVEGFNSIKAHKILATIHFSGMMVQIIFQKKIQIFINIQPTQLLPATLLPLWFLNLNK